MKTLLACLLISFSVFGFSQDPYYQIIDKTSGLPSNSIYDVFQDRKGFMWFASNKGITKYDGSRFTTYTSDQQTSKPGSNISEDSFGRIWYCNFDGYLYFVEHGVLKAFPQKETIGYFKYGIIGNHLYLVQKNKVVVYDLASLQPISTFNYDGKIQYSTVYNGSFYILSKSLYEFSPNKKVKKYTLPDSLLKNYTSPILQKTKQGLAFVSKNWKKYFLFQNGNFTEKNIANNVDYIQNLSFSGSENWISSTNGLYSNALSEGKNMAKHYFPEFNISSIFLDREGNYWISTLNKGLLLVEDFNSIFINTESRPLLFADFGKDLLISSEKDALYILKKENFSLQKIYQGTKNHSINQIITDENQNIYFTSSFFRILNSKKQQSPEMPIAIKEINKIDDKYYTFSASGMSGIFPVDNTKISIWDSVYHSYSKPNNNFGELPFLENCNGKSTVFNPQNQTIYYATNIGLFAKTKNKNKELLFEKKRLYISKLAVYKECIFALSNQSKIYRISKFQQVSELKLPQNFKNESIFKIKIIENTLYIFSEKAVYSYDPIKHHFAELFIAGSNLDISDLAFFNNKIVLATSKGILLAENHQQNSSNRGFPKLVINQALVNNKIVDFSKIEKLQPTENNVNISLSALDFSPSQKSEIWYRINEKDWQQVDKESRTLALNSLSFGHYKIDFRTKANEKYSPIQSLEFTISKPFWLQLWFILPIILLFLSSVYLFFKFRVRKIKKQNQLMLEKMQLEKNMNQSKLKAIKSQMNPHFFYNALNTIQAYILSNEKKLAVNYLSKFSLLTRTILEMTEKDDVNISEEIKTITLYLEMENARFDDELHYDIQCDEILEFENPKIPSMMLQPYIENAIKHGLLHRKGEKKLLISFKKVDENIEITIDDNGIGRKKSNELNLIKNKKHLSFATEAMLQRIELLNMNKENKIRLQYVDKENNAGQPTGTTVIITVPID